MLKEYFTLLEQREINIAEEYRKSIIPKTLYKYIPLGKNEESNKKRFHSLMNNKAWVTPYRVF